MSNKKSEEARMTASLLRLLMGLIMNIVFYAVAVFLIIYFAKAAYTFSYQVFGNQVMDNAPGKSITITVDEKDTMQAVAKTLEQQKIIIDSSSFYMRAILTEKEVHPGTYTVNSSQNYAEILEILDAE